MWEWFLPLAILFITQIVTKADSLILGYGLFRLSSDIEKLPFPLAPMRACAFWRVEDTTDRHGWRWRTFAIGNAGLVFGAIYIGVPTISGTILDQPFQILPIPWLDTTETQNLLPGVATG